MLGALVLASAMKAPIPLPSMRPVTTPMPMLTTIATDEASLIPVTMNGAADGRQTRRITAIRPNPNARSVSLASGSTSSSP